MGKREATPLPAKHAQRPVGALHLTRAITPTAQLRAHVNRILRAARNNRSRSLSQFVLFVLFVPFVVHMPWYVYVPCGGPSVSSTISAVRSVGKLPIIAIETEPCLNLCSSTEYVSEVGSISTKKNRSRLTNACRDTDSWIGTPVIFERVTRWVSSLNRPWVFQVQTLAPSSENASQRAKSAR